MGKVAEIAHDAERLGIGANGPPEPTPWEAVKVNMDDYLTEARNWADGSEVENQEQADAISKLIEDLRKAGEAADDVRKVEKEPFDQAIDEIQERYNAYIAPLKNKKPGSVPKAIEALKSCLKPYLDKLEAKRQELAKIAREAAEKAQQEAEEAARAARGNLEAQDGAEALLEAAAQAMSDAKRVENEKPQAHGGSRALGLKKTYTAVMTDRKAALYHYVATNPDAFVAFLQGLADQDVREGKRQIPGFNIEEGTKL